SLSLANVTLRLIAWNKIKTSVIACVVALMLAGGAGVGLQLSKRANTPVSVIRSFEPVAGEWAGTCSYQPGGARSPAAQAATLSIRTTQQGRVCEIEMRELEAPGRPAVVYAFTHALNQSGDRITTMDDPKIARIEGEGIVTESFDDRGT